jgi:hypothetical protein
MLDLDKEYKWEDIEELISNQVEESTYLEFKDARALRKSDNEKREIGRDVAAFANAGGGILIYGITEKDHKADSPSFINGSEFTQEWLTQIITMYVNRNVKFSIDPIRHKGKLENSIYVVKIPESVNTPHFAKERGYYIRRNVNLDMMQEYEVRASYNKTERTYLEFLQPKIGDSRLRTSSELLTVYTVDIQILIKNVGKVIERIYKAELKLHKEISVSSPELSLIGRPISDGDFNLFSFPNSSPLFQEEMASVAKFTVQITKGNFNYFLLYPIVVQLYYSSDTARLEVPLISHLKHQPRPSTAMHDLELKCFQHRE